MSTGLLLDAGIEEVSAADGASPSDVSLRGGYGRCVREAACGGGTVCVAAVVSGDGLRASHCSAPCVRAEDCPASAAGAPSAICVRSANSGQCYAGCAGSGDCAEGMVCAQVPDASVRICAPSGGITGTNRLAPYQRCLAGDPCADSTCEAANVRVADAPLGYFCTARCSADGAATCPGYDARAASPTVLCVAVGASAPQCHRACAAQSDCDRDGTTCTELATVQGAVVRVCVPRG